MNRNGSAHNRRSAVREDVQAIDVHFDEGSSGSIVEKRINDLVILNYIPKARIRC